MFLSKVHDQKIELLRAAFRNMYLKEKGDYLDGECKMLAEHVLSCQVKQAEKTDRKNALETELKDLKQRHDQKMQELVSANEKIVSMSLVIENSRLSMRSSLDENKSMQQDLEMKDEMIRCLNEELLPLRLEAAEKYALIRELHQVRDDLEKDKEVLISAKPETISHLQEELISLKLQENQYYEQLAEIKNHLQNIKTQLEASEAKRKRKSFEGSIKLSKLGAFWMTKDKNAENEILEEIKKLEERKFFFENRIPDLQNKMDILKRHSQIKEEIRRKLHEKLEDVRIKNQSTEHLLIERKRQYDHLENSALDKVCAIRNSSEEKQQIIDDLSVKLEQMSHRRQSAPKKVMLKEFSTICALEEQILLLEDKINQLKRENLELKFNKFNGLSNPSDVV